MYGKVDSMTQKVFDQILEDMSEEEKKAFAILVEFYPRHNKLILVKKYIHNRYDLGDLKIDMKMIAEEPLKIKKDELENAKAKK